MIALSSVLKTDSMVYGTSSLGQRYLTSFCTDRSFIGGGFSSPILFANTRFIIFFSSSFDKFFAKLSPFAKSSIVSDVMFSKEIGIKRLHYFRSLPDFESNSISCFSETFIRAAVSSLIDN